MIIRDATNIHKPVSLDVLTRKSQNLKKKKDYANSVRESWRLTTEPIRPSRGELEFIIDFFDKKLTKAKVLILGLTPELVDLSIKQGASTIVVIELRKVALDVLSYFAVEDWSSVEFIEGDWRTYDPQFSGEFDIIIGHGSFILLSFPEEWFDVLTILHNYLAPTGDLILRTFVTPFVTYDFEENYSVLLEEFELGRLHMDENTFLSKFLAFASNIRCGAILASTTNGIVDSEKLVKYISYIRDDLDLRYSEESFWKKLRPEFALPTVHGYEDLWPKAAPSWSDVAALLKKTGYSVDVNFIGNRPVPDCFCMAIGTKKK